MHPDEQCSIVGCSSKARSPVQFIDTGLVFDMCQTCAEERVSMFDEAQYYDP